MQTKYNRARAKSRFNKFYSFIQSNDICIYCGFIADTWDHFVPLYVIHIIAANIENIRGKILVPACRECNSTAGAKLFNSLGAKRRYINSRYQIKYAYLLNGPDWTEEELNDLGYVLQTKIRGQMALKSVIKERLKWQNKQNRKAVKIVETALSFGAFGSGSVQRNAEKLGTQKSQQKEKSFLKRPTAATKLPSFEELGL